MSVPPAVVACLAQLPERFDWECVVARRHNSRVHRARAGARRVAIKECFHPRTVDPDAAAATREYAALRNLAAAAAAAGVPPLAPPPLALASEHGAYAMTWVPGETATRSVLRPSSGRRRAIEIGQAVGDWLRRFHALHPLPPRGSDFVRRLGWIGDLRDAHRTDALVLRAAAALASSASDASARELPASWVHGDMKCDNLLIDGHAVAGLDAQMIDDNSVVYDLAPLLNHLALLQWSALGIWQRDKLRLFAGGMLDAYGFEAAPWTLPTLWVRVYLLLQSVVPPNRTWTLRERIACWPVRRELAIAVGALEAQQRRRG